MRRLADLGTFWDGLATAHQSCLLLDYDGTLAPFRAERDSAVPYPGVRERLAAIIRARRTRVVVVSGRAAHDIPPLLDVAPVPEIWGSHGQERISAGGSYQPPVLPQDIQAALDSARRRAVDLGFGDCIEEKPAGVALHWRGLDRRRAMEARQVVEPVWQELAAGSRLALGDFDGGLELRSRLLTKADAVARILDPEPRGTVCAYLGDDLTDEDAFAAIHNRGLGVLVRGEPRETQAEAWLVPPAELLGFLEHWHAARLGGMAQ